MPAQAPISSGDSKPAAFERRRSVRRRHEARAFLQSPTGGPRVEVASVDLSRHGIGLNVASPIPPGTFHVLHLGVGEQRIVTEVRVISCECEPGGAFRVHAEFR